jgi:hypothetical protein
LGREKREREEEEDREEEEEEEDAGAQGTKMAPGNMHFRRGRGEERRGEET